MRMLMDGMAALDTAQGLLETLSAVLLEHAYGEVLEPEVAERLHVEAAALVTHVQERWDAAAEGTHFCVSLATVLLAAASGLVEWREHIELMERPVEGEA